jgi:NTP pyrophosphatase (non-canonical NTP hydrolase)
VLNIQEFDLMKTMEECSEVIQAAAKVIAYGATRDVALGAESSPLPSQLREELMDILLCIRFLEHDKIILPITEEDLREHLDYKRLKIMSRRTESRREGVLDATDEELQSFL